MELREVTIELGSFAFAPFVPQGKQDDGDEGRTGGQRLTVYRFGALEEFPPLVLCATQVLLLTMEADGEAL